MASRTPRKRRPSVDDPFEPLRLMLMSDGPLLADVLMQAVLDEEGVSSPAVDEALLKCALRIHELCSGPQALESATIHQLLGGLYEEEERDRDAARHYRAALHAYARIPGGADQMPLALKTYQRILSRLGRSDQGRSEAKRLRQQVGKGRTKRHRS
jgi:hypothetical protein